LSKRTDGEDVANLELSLLAGVDGLAGVNALSSNEGLLHNLVLVRVTELDGGEGSTTSGVVDDALNDTTNIAVTLGEIEVAVLSSTLSVSNVSVKNGIVTLTLCCIEKM
jgi:hypothetical protein